MATLSLRIREDLKRKAKELARRHGVSLNNFINASIAATVAQDETMKFFADRLKDVDVETLHRRVLAFMKKTKPGAEPSIHQLRQVLGQ